MLGVPVEVMTLALADWPTCAGSPKPSIAVGALGLLVNSAGVASPSLRRTVDSFELDFGTNHMGHFALTGLVLPMMLSSLQAWVVTVKTGGPACWHGGLPTPRTRRRPVLFAATAPGVRSGDFIGPGRRFGVWESPTHPLQ